MTGLCHETSEVVALAAIWFAANRHEIPHPIIPAIRSRFGLSPKEACEALAEANRLNKGGAHATS